MQVALEVNNSSSDQLPSTTTEQTSGVQQTRNSEGLRAPQSETTTSAADQQHLMDLLRTEASSPAYNGEITPTPIGHVAIDAVLIVAAVTVVVAFSVVCQRYFNQILQANK